MSKMLNVHRIWRTIQGEGPFVGRPAVFIRLSGCNLACSWCDTEHIESSRYMSLSEILVEVNRLMGPEKFVVITGGEPFYQPVTEDLIAALVWTHEIQIETNGTMPPQRALPRGVFIVCSPKRGQVMDSHWRYEIDAWKYVVSVDEMKGGVFDGFVEPPGGALVYLQPMDEKDPVRNAENLDLCLRMCKERGYRLSLQMHKIIGVE